jgi:hypothetical protein
MTQNQGWFDSCFRSAKSLGKFLGEEICLRCKIERTFKIAILDRES